MSQVYRERDLRYTRDRSSSSDDEKYKSTTVRRYKVGNSGHPTSRVVETERVERYEDDDDRRSRHSHSHVGRPPGDTLEIDRRVERTSYPERPRSAYDLSPRSSDYRRDDGERYRTVEFEREREFERDDRDRYAPERVSRTRVVEERREVSSPSPRDNYWDRQSRHPWDDRETDVRIDKRVVRREPDGDLQLKEKTLELRDERRDDPRDYKERDLKIERRVVDEREPHDSEIYRREVEYYAPNPPQSPVIIRQKAPKQKVVVHEAPQPAPIIMPRQEPTFIVLREQNHEVARPPEPQNYHHHERRHRRDDRDYESDGYEEDYYIKRTVITRERSPSEDHHKKRHLAEGALAGAGISALVSGRRGKDGDSHDHRGRKVLAGAALGALGSEAVRRARSAYEERYEADDDDYYRPHHRSKSRSRLTKGLAIGAAALAVAGGLKYMQNNKVEKEEASRGRARRRDSVSDYSHSRSRSRLSSRSGRGHSRSRSRSRSKSKANMAKAAAATSAVAGLVHHYRSKSRGKSRSKSRSRSRSRSKSRLRTGAEIAAAGLTGAAASKLWERHKDKKESEHERESDDGSQGRGRGYSRSRSRSRSNSRHSHLRGSTADRELGLVPVAPVVPGVEYGSEPLTPYEERRRRNRQRHRSSSASDREIPKKRSKSRLREVAAAGLGTAAAAIGIKKYSDRQKSKERDVKSGEKNIEKPRSRSRDKRDRARERRSRDRERRRYEENAGDPYYDNDVEARPTSPPHASGGAFYPPPGPIPPPAGPAGFTQHPNPSTMNLNNPYQPRTYNPQNYMDLPPPPPGPPPTGGPMPPAAGPGYPRGPENVSDDPHLRDSGSHPDDSRSAATEQDGLKPQRGRSPSVSSASSISRSERSSSRVKFRALSPQSTETLRRHHEETDRSTAETEDDNTPSDRKSRQKRRKNRRERSKSDPSSNRRHRHRRADSDSDDNDKVEVLPDWFDSSGWPLSLTKRGLRRARTTQGDFEYRPQHEGDWNIRGNWKKLGDVDPQVVGQLAQTVGGMLEGREGILGVLGHVLKGASGGTGAGSSDKKKEKMRR